MKAEINDIDNRSEFNTHAHILSSRNNFISKTK